MRISGLGVRGLMGIWDNCVQLINCAQLSLDTNVILRVKTLENRVQTFSNI